MARYLFKEIKCEIRNWDEKCQSKVTGHFHELILKSRIQTQALTECEKVVQLELFTMSNMFRGRNERKETGSHSGVSSQSTVRHTIKETRKTTLNQKSETIEPCHSGGHALPSRISCHSELLC